MLWFVYWFCIFAPGPVSCERASRLVNITQGPVRGYKHEDIYVFYNIPYAKAPTGSQRFQAPLPPPMWTEVYEAEDSEIICPQGNFAGYIKKSMKIQEDCLVANIYVPDTQIKNIPVVVYIHGGAFVGGWGTEDIPGNAGMKDQVALLRWVKKNIASFGGNPEEITLSGYSAGSSSVDLMILSKRADGLFKRAVLESGANIAAFSIQPDPTKNAKDYAMMLNFDKYADIEALETFYKTISYEQLNSVDVMNRKDSTFLFSPCVEQNMGEETFLEDSPVNILKSGDFKKVPMLYGFNNMEGLFRVPRFETWKSLMNEKFSNFLPADLKFGSKVEMEEVADKIKRFYFGDKTVDGDTIIAFVDYFGDIMFGYPILRSVKFQVEAGNREIYLYEYSYVDDSTPIVPHTNNNRGANHCAQTFTVLDGMGSIKDEKHTKNMRELWLNFMTTGKPSGSNLPDWSPVAADWSPHMSLNKTFVLKGSLLKERATFWEDIYNKYYFDPLSPKPKKN